MDSQNTTGRKRNHPFLEAVYGHDDACSLAKALADGTAAPVTVARACLEAAEESPNVYLSISPERALAEAEASRARHRQGLALSLFDGMPVNWKDTFDVAGAVTTSGSALFRDNPPEEKDGALAEAAAQAGMVCIGKVNTCEFAYSIVGVNSQFGSPANPHAPRNREESRACGGSSSGSAAAVAAGIVPVSVASDAGGSIRIPAAFTGICGFKPTSGRYSHRGLRPLARSVDSPGPMARSIRDLVVMDGILRGNPLLEIPMVPTLRGTRFVTDPSLLDAPFVSEAIRAAVNDAFSRLEDAGAIVERRVLEPFHEARRNMVIMGAEVFTELKPLLDDPASAARMDPRIRARAELSRNIPAHTIIRAYWERPGLIEAVRRDLNGAVLLLPSVGHTAPLLAPLENDDEVFAHYGQSNTRLASAANYLNMPAVALPAGMDADGLPIGVSLYRAAGEDDVLLQTALAAEPFIAFA